MNTLILQLRTYIAKEKSKIKLNNIKNKKKTSKTTRTRTKKRNIQKEEHWQVKETGSNLRQQK